MGAFHEMRKGSLYLFFYLTDDYVIIKTKSSDDHTT